MVTVLIFAFVVVPLICACALGWGLLCAREPAVPARPARPVMAYVVWTLCAVSVIYLGAWGYEALDTPAPLPTQSPAAREYDVLMGCGAPPTMAELSHANGLTPAQRQAAQDASIYERVMAAPAMKVDAFLQDLHAPPWWTGQPSPSADRDWWMPDWLNSVLVWAQR